MHILKVYSDLETPVSVYLKLVSGEDYSFLLESAEHEASFGRYSFIGMGKKEEIWLTPEGVLMIDGEAQEIEGNPLHSIIGRLQKYSIQISDPDLPPFIGGAVGYVGYSYVRYLEKLTGGGGEFPHFHFIVPRHLIAFDHVKNQMCIISDDPEEVVFKLSRLSPPPRRQKTITTEPESNFDREDFYKAVEKARKYIIDGDIFQVVLSQKFSFRTTLQTFSLYRALRMINPSPYLFYLKFKDTAVFGSSPEMLVKRSGEKAFLKPIAGTRRRGKSVEEDLKMEKELVNDEKEKAEHVMLLDLGRNDLGKVCEGGSVKVEENMVVERYSYVMHLVSQIAGRMRKDKNAVDLFEAAFPAGTVTGAPKVRAMEIISELEPGPRGPYAGAVAYFSYPDKEGTINMDSGLMIRSFFFKGQEGVLQAGAGIVYDSDPRLEYKETMNKLQALFRSLDLAEKIQGGLI